jgi:hypothetical protein
MERGRHSLGMQKRGVFLIEQGQGLRAMLLGDDAAQLLMGADIRGELLFAQIGNLLQLLRTFALAAVPLG